MDEPWLLGIEIGGTKLQLGIGQGLGGLTALERLRVEPSRGSEGILEQIQLAVPTLLRKANLERGRIGAVGIGFGGPVDSSRGRTLRSYQVEGWDDFPLAAWIGERLEIPRVVLQNDADAAGLAEARFGAGIGRSPLLYVTVGSGIGGALIVEDRIYRGFGQGATEIGHLHVPESSRFGDGVVELEQAASGWGIAAAAQVLAREMIEQGRDDWIVLRRAVGEPGRVTAIMIAQAAGEGDLEASSILDRAQRAVAFALSQAVSLLAPRRIVMGGGVSLIGEEGWFDPIRHMVQQQVFQPFRGSFDIMPAALGEEVVVHGALAVARDAISPP